MSSRSKLFAAFVAVAAVLVSILPVANAQNAQGSGNGFQISPTRTDITGNPGETKNFTINLKNVTQGELVAKAYLNDFESDGTSGTPKIIVDTNKRTPYSISNMLSGLKDLELKPGESKDIPFTLTIPKDAAPGAYFGAIRYAAIPKDQATDQNGQQVALTASIGHLVFVEVPGNVNEQIKVESLKIQHDNKAGSFFFSSPNKASISIKNLGNGFSRPFGRVSISKGKEVFSYEVNTGNPKGIVLPNSTRTFTDGIKNIKTPGRYKVVASVAYGNGGEVVNYKTSFWYVPVWCILVILGLIVAIAAGSYVLYRRRFGAKTKKTKRTRRK